MKIRSLFYLHWSFLSPLHFFHLQSLSSPESRTCIPHLYYTLNIHLYCIEGGIRSDRERKLPPMSSLRVDVRSVELTHLEVFSVIFAFWRSSRCSSLWREWESWGVRTLCGGAGSHRWPRSPPSRASRQSPTSSCATPFSQLSKHSRGFWSRHGWGFWRG